MGPKKPSTRSRWWKKLPQRPYPPPMPDFISPFSISKTDTFLTYKLNASPIMILISHLGGDSMDRVYMERFRCGYE